MQTTYVMIKPDGVQRGLVGEIVNRFERKGLQLVGMKSMIPDQTIARTHYAVHAERPFFGELVDFMTSERVVLMVLEGDNAILRNREIMGATDPAQADEGTIRKLYAESKGANTVHGSDSPASAAREVAYFFGAAFEIN